MAERLSTFRCDVVDEWNLDGCPVESPPYASFIEAKAAGWTGTIRASRCPGHAVEGCDRRGAVPIGGCDPVRSQQGGSDG